MKSIRWFDHSEKTLCEQKANRGKERENSDENDSKNPEETWRTLLGE